MHSLLYVSLDGFYAAAALAGRADWGGRAIVVHRDGAVLDSGPAARARRVGPGTPLSEAKAILREDGVYLSYSEQETRAARDAWLDVCAAFSETVEPGMPHEAWVDLSLHPDPMGTANELLREVATRTGLLVRAGLAPGKWLAQLAAQPCEAKALGLGVPVLEAVTDPAGFLAPLPTGCLSPVEPAHRERLEFLGYRRVGQVAAAPLRLLTAQFGRSGPLIQQAAQGRCLDRARPLYPADAVSERVAFEGPVADRSVLEAGLTELATRLAQALCASDRIGDRLELVVEPESGVPLVRRRQLARPVQAARPLRVGLGALMGDGPPFAPVAVRGVMPGLRPAPRVQRSLATMETRDEREHTAETALRSVRAAFGDGAVVRASDVVLPRRLRVLRAWREATGWH